MMLTQHFRDLILAQNLAVKMQEIVFPNLRESELFLGQHFPGLPRGITKETPLAESDCVFGKVNSCVENGG